MRVNFSSVEDFEPVPAGPYLVAITDCKCEQSKSSEYDNLTWTLTIQEGEFKNRKLFMLTPMHPKALFRLKQFCETAKGEKLPKAELDIDPKEYFGCQVTAIVTTETYEEQERNKVVAVKPASAARPATGSTGSAGGTSEGAPTGGRRRRT